MKNYLLNKIIFVALISTVVCTAWAADEESLIAVLKSDAGVVEKCAACQQLKIHGTVKSVEALAAVLGDERVGHAARYALESMPYPEAGTALRDAIGKTSDGIKAGLIDSVGRRQDKAAVGLLLPLLSDSDTVVATATATALGKIGTQEAAEHLEKALKQVSDGDLRNVIADSYMLCAEKLTVKNPGRAESMYQGIFKSDLPGQFRSAALIGLVELSPQSAMTYLTDAFEQDDPIMLKTAIELCRDIQDEKVTDYLIDLLPRVPNSVKVVILTVLGDKGNKRSFSMIRDQYQSDSESVRIAALKAMSKTGDLTIVNLFAEYASQANKAEADTARQCLYLLQLEGTDERILQGCENAKLSADTRVELIEAVIIREIDAVMPLLFDYTQSEDSGIRKASWKALKKMAGVEHSNKIVKLMLNAKSSDLHRVCGAVLAIGKNPEEKALVSKSVISVLPVASNLSTRSEMIELLGKLGAEEGFDILMKALEAKETKIQNAAIRGLSNWPDARPAKTLCLIAERSDDNTTRSLALRGYLQFTVSDGAIANKTKTQKIKQAFEMSKNTREKKYVLSVLARVEDYSSFQLALQYMNVKELESEAQAAAINIAEVLAYSYPSEIKAELEEILENSTIEFTIKRAKEIIEKINSSQGYLTSWQISGPYTKADSEFEWLFTNRFAPEQRGSGELPWKHIASGTHPHWNFLVDIGKVIPGNYRVAYVRNKVYVDHPTKVKVLIGSDDGFKFWINQKLCGQNHVARGCTPDSDVFEAQLQQGWNVIMLKITQMSAGWEFSVKMTNIDSSPIENMKLSLDITEDDLPQSFDPNHKGEVVDIKGNMKFEKVRIGDVTYEAVSAFDVDKDGNLDIVSGEYWFAGPDFKQKHQICTLQQSGDYYDDFCDYPMDVNGDGYLDIITGAWFTKTLRWRENPKGKPIEWKNHTIDECGHIETIRCWDVDGDGHVEIVPNLPGGPLNIYTLVRDGGGNPTATFKKMTIYENHQGHGLGFGDVNSDGRGDFILSAGWLEAPKEPFEEKWIFHQEFNLGATSVPVLVYDVDKDGLADLIDGQGHGYGLNYWQQRIDENSNRTWMKHQIEPNRSQFHDMMLADLDKDGEPEVITGKRYRAHSGHDPGTNDPVGLYYFKIKNGQFERVTLDYGPVDSHSGVGIYFWVEDIDNNGFKDILAPGKEGLFLFKNNGYTM